MNVRRLDHVGIAVSSLDRALALYRDVLGLPVASQETLDAMKLRVARVKAGESVLELLEPLPGEEVVSQFLSRRGEGLHHVCLEVDDVAAAMRELQSRGYEPVWPEPRPGAGGRLANFLRPRNTGGVLLELNQPQRS